MKLLGALVIMIVAGGCSRGTEYWIKQNLIEAGLPRNASSCIADRLTKRFDEGEGFSVRGPEWRTLQAKTVRELLPQIQPLLDAGKFPEISRIASECETV